MTQPPESTTTPDSTSPTSNPSPSSSPTTVTMPGLRIGGLQKTPSATTPTGEAPSPGSASAGAPPADPIDSRTDTPSASPDDPEPAGTPLKLKRQPLADVFRGLVLGATVALHQALARTELEQQQGVWLMQSEDEAAGVADPLASIANRHAGGSLVNPDTADLIAAGVAAAGYVISNALRAMQLRRAARSMRRAGLHPETGTDTTQEAQQ